MHVPGFFILDGRIVKVHTRWSVLRSVLPFFVVLKSVTKKGKTLPTGGGHFLFGKKLPLPKTSNKNSSICIAVIDISSQFKCRLKDITQFSLLK